VKVEAVSANFQVRKREVIIEDCDTHEESQRLNQVVVAFVLTDYSGSTKGPA